MENHVVWQEGCVSRSDRNRLNNHKSGVIWLTGLSASGKSTIAHALEKELFNRGVRCCVLDGDNVRHGLTSDLGFSPGDRRENLRRVAEVAKLMADAGLLVIAAFISPCRDDRRVVREILDGNMIAGVYVKCSIGECERRDPKGQYMKARAGIIRDYTGITSPYEEPLEPGLVLDTEENGVRESVGLLLDFLRRRGLF